MGFWGNEADTATDPEANREYFRFAYKVCARTCKEFVLEFFRYLIRDTQVPSNQIVIVDDNFQLDRDSGR